MQLVAITAQCDLSSVEDNCCGSVDVEGHIVAVAFDGMSLAEVVNS
jgi:hypothetical protein